jgi:hypothetical protein
MPGKYRILDEATCLCDEASITTAVLRLEIQDMLYVIIIQYMNPEILYDARYWKRIKVLLSLFVNIWLYIRASISSSECKGPSKWQIVKW